MPVIKATLNEQEFSLTILSKIDREALHGKSTIKPLKDGKPLKRAYLRPNGQIIRNTDRKNPDTDPQGSIVEKPVYLEIQNAAATLHPGVADAGMKLRPGKLTDLAEFVTDRFHAVEVVGLPEGLYHTSYNLKPTTTPEAAILLVKEKAEAFLLIGEARVSTYVGKVINYDFFGADETEETDETDELSIGF